MNSKILKTAIFIIFGLIFISGFSIESKADAKELGPNINVGDTVYYGNYEQDGNKKNGKEDILWRVLDVNNGKALLISDKIIAFRKYNKEDLNITWENSSIREWLNTKFVDTAFSDYEKNILYRKYVVNDNNEEFGVSGGNDTKDSVFLLSIYEAENYFNDYNDRIAYSTFYARKSYYMIYHRCGCSEARKKAMEGLNGDDFYWLRSPGADRSMAAFVSNEGEIDSSSDAYHFYGWSVDWYLGVRPALWVYL